MGFVNSCLFFLFLHVFLAVTQKKRKFLHLKKKAKYVGTVVKLWQHQNSPSLFTLPPKPIKQKTFDLHSYGRNTSLLQDKLLYSYLVFIYRNCAR